MVTVSPRNTLSSSSSRKRKSGCDDTADMLRSTKRTVLKIGPGPKIAMPDEQTEVVSEQSFHLPYASHPNHVQQETNFVGTTTQPISPTSNSLSQLSQSSQMAESPSPAPSSIVLEPDMIMMSGSKDTRQCPDPGYEQQFRRSSVLMSRSPSGASMDSSNRSSGRTRKPTSKAQALANAGTKFFQDLKRVSDDAKPEQSTQREGDTMNTCVETNDQPHDTGSFQAEDTTGDVLSTVFDGPTAPAEPEILNSVENVLPTSVRSSSRQRKPTAKAVAAEIETSPQKRTASPLDSERATNIHKTGVSIPREPSKLRQSLLSGEDENGSKDDTTFDNKSPEPRTKVIILKTTPASTKKARAKSEKTGQCAEVSVVDKNSSTECDFSCLSPALILLAFAKYAANDADPVRNDDDDDRSGENDFVLPEGSIIPGFGSQKMNKDLISNILGGYCQCMTPHVVEMGGGGEISSDLARESSFGNASLEPLAAGSHPNTLPKTSRHRYSVPIVRSDDKSSQRKITSRVGTAITPYNLTGSESKNADDGTLHGSQRNHMADRDRTLDRNPQQLLGDKEFMDQHHPSEPGHLPVSSVNRVYRCSRPLTTFDDLALLQLEHDRPPVKWFRPEELAKRNTPKSKPKSSKSRAKPETQLLKSKKSTITRPPIKLLGPKTKPVANQQRSTILGENTNDDQASNASNKRHSAGTITHQSSSTSSTIKKHLDTSTSAISNADNTNRSLKITLKVRALPE